MMVVVNGGVDVSQLMYGTLTGQKNFRHVKVSSTSLTN